MASGINIHSFFRFPNSYSGLSEWTHYFGYPE